MHVFELTKQLIQIESITGNEAPVFHFLSDYLKSKGWKVKSFNSQKNRPNLFAYLDKPKFIFSSHMDTVPPYIPFKEDKDTIYGRGACDAKGIIAAQITAALELQKQGVQNIGLLYLVGEEVDHRGAIDAAKKIPKVHSLIMGEPTENKMAVGTKGIIKLHIQAKGKAAHSAYPHLGLSAIHELLTILKRIQRIALPKDRFLGQTNLNIGMIHGGVAANVLAPEASCEILIRTVKKSRALFQKIKKLKSSGVRIHCTSMNDPIFLDTLPGFKKTVVAFNTDIPYLKSRTKNVYLLGPGSILNAHTAHEKISKKELLDAVRSYGEIIRSLK